ncbi:hypothetical protein MSAN_00890600 [Mycena sanguinolenta]|uniref:Zn(2)-C6 fungal-type domain-containing protein n=1 Tax=Mycena sanguinolenta TaxID=230812 RepID=A0A8H7DB68_9AGAR|nr:hypothetical protein MSAN_00890600 [Mycena sanguinolenta]
MAEKTNAVLRQRRPTRPICATCQMLKIRCEYKNLEDDCESCKSKGVGCRYFQSAAPTEVEVILEDIGFDATNEPRLPLGAKRLLVKFLSSCSLHSALDAARTDSECDQVVEDLKSKWRNARHWVLALATIDMSLFAIDAQSLFRINSFSRKAIATSGIATFLGFVCGTWFWGRYRSLQPREFMTRARDIYGSYAFFALSARLPSLAVLISMSALGAFVVCVAYETLPVLTIVLGSIFFIMMGLQFIIRGSEVFYGSILEAFLTAARWIQQLRDKARRVAIRAPSDLPPDAGEHSQADGRARQRESS